MYQIFKINPMQYCKVREEKMQIGFLRATTATIKLNSGKNQGYINDILLKYFHTTTGCAKKRKTF